MKMNELMALVCVASAGLACSAEVPVVAEVTRGQVRDAGHLYFNAVTGERVLSLAEAGDQQRGVDGTEGTEIWVVGGGAGCLDIGSSSSMYYVLDVPDSGGGFTSPALLDWGDIACNTVVDCVQIHWITNHQDADLNEDGVPDGVEGFGATWTFWDGMNGRSPQMEQIALPIVEFSFFNLPGDLLDTDDLLPAFYTANVDLGASGSLGSSMIFEIGDTDSDLQGAALHNARMDLNDADMDGIPDLDPDQDGLADWGWSIDYTQPGTIDVDNADGDMDPMTGIDGDPNAQASAGVSFGLAQPGEAVFDSMSGQWDWVGTGPTAGLNEDLFALVDNGVSSGPMNFGGFSCDPYVPRADFAIVLYRLDTGPFPCTVDLNGDNSVDFFDIAMFVTNRIDWNGDTVFDFFDISAFVTEYSAGCPGIDGSIQ